MGRSIADPLHCSSVWLLSEHGSSSLLWLQDLKDSDDDLEEERVMRAQERGTLTGTGKMLRSETVQRLNTRRNSLLLEKVLREFPPILLSSACLHVKPCSRYTTDRDHSMSLHSDVVHRLHN